MDIGLTSIILEWMITMDWKVVSLPPFLFFLQVSTILGTKCNKAAGSSTTPPKSVGKLFI